MSDTTLCSNCGSALPAGAAFCTNCGTRLDAAPVVPPPGPDATRVDTPSLNDATQVFSPPPAAPTGPSAWEPTNWGTSTPPPSGQAPPPPAAPLAPPPGAPLAPPPAPAPPGAPAWQAPPATPAAPPPGTANWGAAPPSAAPPTPAWTPPGGTPTPGVTGAAPKSGSPLGGIAAVLGGVLVLAGTFTGWVVNKATDGAISGWDMTSGDKGFRLPSGSMLTFKSSDPYLVLALGLGALVIGIALFTGAAAKPARLAAIAIGVAVVIVMALDWTSITDLVSKNAPSDFEVKTGIGFILAAAGGVVTALGGVLPGKK